MNFRRMVRQMAWGYLALVLLLAPLLGLMHGVVHGGGGLLHAAELQVHEGDSRTHPHAGAHGWLADLFSAHADDSDCRVYNGLCHSDGMAPPPALVLPIALSPFVFHFLEGEVLARKAALFEARAPPLVR